MRTNIRGRHGEGDDCGDIDNDDGDDDVITVRLLVMTTT